MQVVLHFLAVLGFCAAGIALAGWLILRFGRWLDRAENGASGFARPAPYTEAVTETDSSFLEGDFDPQAGLDRLAADIERLRPENPTAPPLPLPIPAQRKELS